MVAITTRAGKGLPLTNAEIDENFTNLKIFAEDLDGALEDLDGALEDLDGVTTTTAVNKNLVVSEFCTVTSAGVTVTLPASPAAGARVAVGVLNFVNTVIARNSQNIMGLAENLTIYVEIVTVSLRFVDATRGWKII